MSPSDLAIPDRKGLREFGLVTGGIVAALFGVFFPWLLSRPVPMWPWILAGTLGVWALLAPSSLRVVYAVWMRFGLLMSRVTTPLILGIVFYGVISPIARFRALAGKDSLARRFDATLPSYRVPSVARDAQNLEKPY